MSLHSSLSIGNDYDPEFVDDVAPYVTPTPFSSRTPTPTLNKRKGAKKRNSILTQESALTHKFLSMIEKTR